MQERLRKRKLELFKRREMQGMIPSQHQQVESPNLSKSKCLQAHRCAVSPSANDNSVEVQPKNANEEEDNNLLGGLEVDEEEEEEDPEELLRLQEEEMLEEFLEQAL
jgi:hypothetical protein